MPNHVHVLFRPDVGRRLEDIVQSWKGFSAREINRRLNLTGTLWQADDWDRLVRNEEHLRKCRNYIRNNPGKANLIEGQFVLFERSGAGKLPLLMGEGAFLSLCARRVAMEMRVTRSVSSW
jgi:hypothetical protein